MNRFLVFFLFSFVIHLALGAMLVSRTGLFKGFSNGTSVEDTQGREEEASLVEYTEAEDPLRESEVQKTPMTLSPPSVFNSPPSSPSVEKKPAVKKPAMKTFVVEKAKPVSTTQKRLSSPKKKAFVVKKSIALPVKPKEKPDVLQKEAFSQNPELLKEPEEKIRQEEDLVDEDDFLPEQRERENIAKAKEEEGNDIFKKEEAAERKKEDSQEKTADLDQSGKTNENLSYREEMEKSVEASSSEEEESTLPSSPSSPDEKSSTPEFHPSRVREYRQLTQQIGNLVPKYPQEALENKWEGRVDVIYYVNEGGLVEKIQVQNSSGYRALDNAALKSLARYRYHPGQEGWVSHPVEFFLDKNSEIQLTRPLRTQPASESP